MWHLLFAYVCSEILSFNLALCCYRSLNRPEKAIQVDVLGTQTEQMVLMLGIDFFFFLVNIWFTWEPLFFQPVSFGSEFMCFGRYDAIGNSALRLIHGKVLLRMKRKVPNCVNNTHFSLLFNFVLNNTCASY